MRDTLRIETLGGFTATLNGAPVSGFVSRKVEALLVYLAREQREHPRELLAELFWPDNPQVRAMGNLRSAIASLQRQLAPFLVVTRQTISVNPDHSVWLDANELHHVLDSSEERWRANGQLSRAEASHLEAVVALYKGDFLAGFHLHNCQEFEDWKLLEAERCRQRVIA